MLLAESGRKKISSLVLSLDLSDTLPLLSQHHSWPNHPHGKHLPAGWAAARGPGDLRRGAGKYSTHYLGTSKHSRSHPSLLPAGLSGVHSPESSWMHIPAESPCLLPATARRGVTASCLPHSSARGCLLQQWVTRIPDGRCRVKHHVGLRLLKQRCGGSVAH